MASRNDLSTEQQASEPQCEMASDQAQAEAQAGNTKLLSGLLSLPKEIREHIYDLCLPALRLRIATVARWTGFPPHLAAAPLRSLFTVSRLVRAESTAVFYRKLQVHLVAREVMLWEHNAAGVLNLDRWLTRFGPRVLPHSRDINIQEAVNWRHSCEGVAGQADATIMFQLKKMQFSIVVRVWQAPALCQCYEDELLDEVMQDVDMLTDKVKAAMGARGERLVCGSINARIEA